MVAAAHLNTQELRWILWPHRLVFSVAFRCSIITFLHILTNWITMNPNRKANPELLTETSADVYCDLLKQIIKRRGMLFFVVVSTTQYLSESEPNLTRQALDSWNVRLNQKLFQVHYSVNWGKRISFMSAHSYDATQLDVFLYLLLCVGERVRLGSWS